MKTKSKNNVIIKTAHSRSWRMTLLSAPAVITTWPSGATAAETLVSAAFFFQESENVCS
jgi:hypothetical protein